jgi:hypothetical protein
VRLDLAWGFDCSMQALIPQRYPQARQPSTMVGRQRKQLGELLGSTMPSSLYSERTEG